MRRALVVAALGLFVLPAVVEAGNLTRAKRYFRQAEALFKAGSFEEASKLYQRAYQEKALPAFFINIGQCYRKRGDCETALQYYRRYVAEDASKRHLEQVKGLIKVCEEELAAREQLKTEAQPPPTGTTTQQPPPPTPTQPARKGLHPLYFWSAVGVTTAMVLLGTVTGGVALNKSSEYKDPATSEAEAAGLKDQGEDLKVASNVTFGLALTAAAASAALFFFTDFDGEKPTSAPTTTVGAAPLSGGAIVRIGGGF